MRIVDAENDGPKAPALAAAVAPRRAMVGAPSGDLAALPGVGHRYAPAADVARQPADVKVRRRDRLEQAAFAEQRANARARAHHADFADSLDPAYASYKRRMEVYGAGAEHIPNDPSAAPPKPRRCSVGVDVAGVAGAGRVCMGSFPPAAGPPPAPEPTSDGAVEDVGVVLVEDVPPAAVDLVDGVADEAHIGGAANGVNVEGFEDAAAAEDVAVEVVVPPEDAEVAEVAEVGPAAAAPLPTSPPTPQPSCSLPPSSLVRVDFRRRKRRGGGPGAGAP